MRILSAAQSRELDRLAIEERGIAGARLMARAGQAVAQTIEREYPRALAGRIGILCGGGNNGGDGLIVARWLRQRQVRVLTLVFAPPGKLRGDAAGALAQLRGEFKTGPEPVFVPDAEAWAAQRAELLNCHLIVDALFGTGLVRPVRTWLGEVIGDVNREFRGPVLAVDIPSGLGADGEGPAEAADAAVVRAARTVTFTTPKLGHYLSRHSGCVGTLEVVPIGIPEELLDQVLEPLDKKGDPDCQVRLTCAADLDPYRAPRARDAHKGEFGHVLVVAGSVGKSGAAVLASTAALRTGAGLVTAAVPRSILPLVAAAQPELMTEPLPETAEGQLSFHGLEPEGRAALLAARLAGITVLALGPGLTRGVDTAAAVEAWIHAAAVPVVLDADGLNAYAGRLDRLRFTVGAVLTPHPGEMARLFGVATAEVQARRRYYAQRLAAETGAVTVLKGQFSLIADPGGEVIVNPTGNPGMATGGSGDALTGMIAGLIAQFPRRRLVETVAAAVCLHGRAGDLAAARVGEMALIAGDIIAALPAALAEGPAAARAEAAPSC
ncbi:MAG TPA: NAD(P)H-hydrate dehydratase [Terriglobales bacterium]|nr:NAD(P)H-hydrate dehydratase [Terriglobales bacterium]